jgi:hypothetical protein
MNDLRADLDSLEEFVDFFIGHFLAQLGEDIS